MLLKMACLAFFAAAAMASPAQAVTSTESVPSSMAGNGHNISFDGRIVIFRETPGWSIRILRPEAVTYRPDGFPDATGPMWSPKAQILIGDPATLIENALGICEPDPSRAPYACDEAGTENSNGPYDCYDLYLLDSDALTPPENGGFVMRRRHLTLWVANPRTANAEVHKFDLSSTLEPLSTSIRGIEPTVTRDGKLMVYQGHPDNDGKIDILMYTVNANACAASNWSAPRVISQMASDPAVAGTYRLAERALRSASGEVFAPGELFRGAYPWLTPDGDALIFMASNMACQSENVPAGCGPRRNSFSAIGYSTNWGIAIVDGGVNPHTNDVVRLFFSSPGPNTFAQLPVSSGADVWPFIGSNTSNYVELIFDDGLDGNYAGMWHFNESVSKGGDLDLAHTPDVSGYFNTGTMLGGLGVATSNNGIVGRALTFDGLDDRIAVPHSITLNPLNGISIDFWIQPTEDPDCDGNNNYRLLLAKGPIDTATYSVVFEENRALQVRFNVNNTQESVIGPPLPLNEWTHVSCEYDGPTGEAGCWYDEVRVTTVQLAVGVLGAGNGDLLIGGPGARAACPNGDGAFKGMLDELAISRYSRHLSTPQEPSDAGVGSETDASSPGSPGDPDAGVGEDAGGDQGGCGCGAGGGAGSKGGPMALFLVLTIWLAAGRRAAHRDPRRG